MTLHRSERRYLLFTKHQSVFQASRFFEHMHIFIATCNDHQENEYLLI
jgi:hypothetical protein